MSGLLLAIDIHIYRHQGRTTIGVGYSERVRSEDYTNNSMFITTPFDGCFSEYLL
jgi:hypothetical protein